MQPKSISLHCQEGGSDKLYNVLLEPSGSGWVVNFQYGRRGSSLRPGTKTKEPLPYDKALAIYEKVVAGQLKDHYKVIGGDVHAVQASVALGPDRMDTGMRAQLLNPITREEAERYILDPLWVAQEKHDGERRPLRVDGQEVFGAQRDGFQVPLKKIFEAELLALSQGRKAEFDAEEVGDKLFVFDLLSHEDLAAGAPYETRLQVLGEAFEKAARQTSLVYVELVHTVSGEARKRDFVDRVYQQGGEGVVFKRLDCPYEPGRPNTGGPQLKLKFYEEATCLVAGTNLDKRSVKLALKDEKGEWVSVGSVSIPPDQEIPADGSLAEIRYLYAYRGGSLFQPTFKFARTDLTQDACVLSQLKYKGEARIPQAEFAQDESAGRPRARAR